MYVVIEKRFFDPVKSGDMTAVLRPRKTMTPPIKPGHAIELASLYGDTVYHGHVTDVYSFDLSTQGPGIAARAEGKIVGTSWLSCLASMLGFYDQQTMRRHFVANYRIDQKILRAWFIRWF